MRSCLLARCSLFTCKCLRIWTSFSSILRSACASVSSSHPSGRLLAYCPWAVIDPRDSAVRIHPLRLCSYSSPTSRSTLVCRHPIRFFWLQCTQPSPERGYPTLARLSNKTHTYTDKKRTEPTHNFTLRGANTVIESEQQKKKVILLSFPPERSIFIRLSALNLSLQRIGITLYALD